MASSSSSTPPPPNPPPATTINPFDTDHDHTYLYTVLKVPKTATPDEIKTSYRKLTQIYHPDKHLDPDKKVSATLQFTIIKEAYEILSDELKRKVYDEFGKEGIDAMHSHGMEMTKYEDIRERFEKAGAKAKSSARGMNQGAERDSLFSIKNGLQMNMDGRGLVELVDTLVHAPSNSDEDWFYSPFIITQTSLGADATLYVTNRDIVTMKYSLVQKGGRSGTSPLALTGRHQFSSNMFAELSTIIKPTKKGLGVPNAIAAKIWRRLSQRSSAMLEASLNPINRNSMMAISTTRQLTNLTMGQLSWTAGAASGVSVSFRRIGGAAWEESDESWLQKESNRLVRFFHKLSLWIQKFLYPCAFQVQFNVGTSDTSVSGSVKRGLGNSVHTFNEDGGHIKLRGSYGLDGWTCEIGGGRIYVHQNMSWNIAVLWSDDGIYFKLKVGRGGHRFVVPVVLCEKSSYKVALSTIGITGALVALFQMLVVRPLKKQYLRKKKEEAFQRRSGDITSSRKHAEEALDLLQNSIQRSREREESIELGGLIIVKAVYGAEQKVANVKLGDPLPTKGQQELDFGYIDVTNAMQYMVENSELHLFSNSKSNLTGFWDPTLLNEDKSLKIWYLFRKVMHSCTVLDFDPVELPMSTHRVEPE